MSFLLSSVNCSSEMSDVLFVGFVVMRILLVEGNPAISGMIELMLTEAAFSVHCTDLGEDGISLAKLFDYDLILLDLKLPDITGYDVLRQLRGSGVKTPVLILSGLLDIENKLRGFALGADDYMTKPFHPEELIARIFAIVRRYRGHSSPIITIGMLNVNVDTRRVDVAGVDVRLSVKEYRILEILTLRKGTTLTKDVLLNHLYGGLNEPDSKSIDVSVCKLRKKLAAAAKGQRFIHTVRGSGYALHEPEGPTA